MPLIFILHSCLMCLGKAQPNQLCGLNRLLSWQRTRTDDKCLLSHGCVPLGSWTDLEGPRAASPSQCLRTQSAPVSSAEGHGHRALYVLLYIYMSILICSCCLNRQPRSSSLLSSWSMVLEADCFSGRPVPALPRDGERLSRNNPAP